MPVYFPDIPPPNLTVLPDNRIWTLVCHALAPNLFSSANVSPSTRSPHPSTVPPSTLPMSDKITSRPIGSGISSLLNIPSPHINLHQPLDLPYTSLFRAEQDSFDRPVTGHIHISQLIIHLITEKHGKYRRPQIDR